MHGSTNIKLLHASAQQTIIRHYFTEIKFLRTDDGSLSRNMYGKYSNVVFDRNTSFTFVVNVLRNAKQDFGFSVISFETINDKAIQNFGVKS